MHILTGYVVRILKPLTLVILVTRLRKHSKYGKYVKVRKTYFVHAKYGLLPIGKVVKFKPCAPLSALKKWSSEKI
ncbi:MAG: 30S ribosomal protein S17 [Candidatus Hodgkinia cicadicola]